MWHFTSTEKRRIFTSRLCLYCTFCRLDTCSTVTRPRTVLYLKRVQQKRKRNSLNFRKENLLKCLFYMRTCIERKIWYCHTVVPVGRHDSTWYLVLYSRRQRSERYCTVTYSLHYRTVKIKNNQRKRHT